MSDTISRLNGALQGRYRVERELGSGGMATVYLARDERHNRHVALKVLKPALAAVVGAERFLAEIETTANLQHPHVLPLHDSGDADGFLFYVMPYVEGESLRSRLDRERQLPVDEAVGIAKTLAEALDFAHRRGVIHRDIKPANILLQDGKPVVADFGIALALSSAGGHRLTETGLSMGTPHYMSPEQATGEGVGPSADVWALGCVLYEMLVGEPPYTGSTPQAILGRIITGEAPSARAERRSVPPGVEAAIRKALEKLPADRFTGADAFAKALANPGFRHGEGADSGPGASGRRTVFRTAAVLAGILVVAVVVALLVRPPDPAPIAATIPLPPDARLSLNIRTFFDLSPDGGTVAYNATNAVGERQIYMRQLDDFEATVVPGSTDAISLRFSRDGQSLAYQIGARVRRAPVGGGPSVTVCATDCSWLNGAWWTGGDTLIFTRGSSGLFKVPASGGDPVPLTTLDVAVGEVEHVFPEVLPGGGVLYGVRFSTGDEEIRLLSDGESRTVLPGTSVARYANRWLLYAAGSSLFAMEFDPVEGTTLGEPVPVVDDLLFGNRPVFDVADDGTLAYVAQSASPNQRVLVRVGREGESNVVYVGEHRFEHPRLSPVDSTLLLFADRGDLWTLDVSSKTQRRLTVDGGNRDPIWAGGNRVIYGSDRDGVGNLFIKSADERVDSRRLLTSEQQQWPDAVTPDGGTLVFSQMTPATNGDIWRVRLEADAAPELLLGDELMTWPGGVSADGRWLAYVALREEVEVYVTDFPDLVDHRRVSIAGGTEPVWSPRGDELFYRDGDRMMVVAYRTAEDGQFDFEPARELFEGSYQHCCPGLAEYAVAADGQSFFMLQGQGVREIRVWRGWEDRAAGTGRR